MFHIVSSLKYLKTSNCDINMNLFIYDNKYVLSKVLTDFSVLFPIISSNHNLAIEFVSYLRQTS